MTVGGADASVLLTGGGSGAAEVGAGGGAVPVRVGMDVFVALLDEMTVVFDCVSCHGRHSAPITPINRMVAANPPRTTQTSGDRAAGGLGGLAAIVELDPRCCPAA